MTPGPDKPQNAAKEKLISFDDEFPLPSIPGVDDWAHRVAPRVKGSGASFEQEPLPKVSEVLSQERTPPTRQKLNQAAPQGSPEPPPPSAPPLEKREKRPNTTARKAPKGLRFTPRAAALTVLGAAACGLAWFQGPRLVEHLVAQPVAEVARSVVGATPEAIVYRGSEELGGTPLVVEWEEPGERVRLERAGYLPEEISLGEQSPDGMRIERWTPTLAFAPRPLKWDDLAVDTQIWWGGREVKPEQLTEALPGSYQLKLKPPGEPTLTLQIEVPEPEAVPFGPIEVGSQVREALAQRPRLTIGWKAEAKKPDSKTVLRLVESKPPEGASPFSTEVALVQDGGAVTVVVPRAGSYSVSYSGGTDFKPYRATLTAEVGKTADHQLAFEDRPKAPPPVASPSYSGWSSGGGGSSYRPVYRPPSGGGGGGGGRIAPPSF